MNKRNLATVLWFVMGWMCGSAVAIVAGLPTLLGGALLAFAFAAFIRLGPGRRLWAIEAPVAPTSTAVPSGQFARE